MSLFYDTCPDVAVISIKGPDVDTFIQGLISVDIRKCTHDQTLYGVLLSPQGRFLHDFFISRPNPFHLLLQTQEEQKESLIKKLQMYRLRSKVDIEDLSDEFQLIYCFGDQALKTFNLSPTCGHTTITNEDQIYYTDPRLIHLGAKLLFKKNHPLTPQGQKADYRSHRMKHGVPEGLNDLTAGKSLPMELGFDQLHALDWDKGCYMGQEITARMKYRALLKKRLIPIANIDPQQTLEITQNHQKIATLSGIYQSQGWSLMPLGSLEIQDPIFIGQKQLFLHLPQWMGQGIKVNSAHLSDGPN